MFFMRVNARFDGEAEQQLNYLAEITGTGVSEVLRASVQHYYDQLRAQRSGLTHFAAFVGCGSSGRSDIADSYKARLAEGWDAKHQNVLLAVHEPTVPYLGQSIAAVQTSRKAFGKMPKGRA
ncbi:MAG: hypothetical protein LBH10_04465 [Burkholderiaceae bacterium]|jgi:hypothetical protein|nr:hypothetical protein [Burkholderiaceae bacterium]